MQGTTGPLLELDHLRVTFGDTVAVNGAIFLSNILYGGAT